MGQTYNITMKHFNGVDYDTLLPATRITHIAGIYMGNGINMADGGQEITLGFKPKFVIITRGWVESQTLSPNTFMAGEAMMSKTENYLQFTDTGFRVGLAPGNANTPVRTNQANTSYSYVAFQ